MSRDKKSSISWDEYFMSLAMLVALRSKDPSTKVGAVLVKENKVIGTGYNGFPSGCDEDRFSWNRDESKGWLNTKYPYVIHAEANALLNSVSSTKGSRVYVTLHPCNECAKLLVQGGITEVIYLDHKHKELDGFKAAEKLLEVTSVKIRHYPASEINIDAIIENFNQYR